MGHKRDNVEQILESCLEQIQTGQETVDSALARYPEQADELRPLLEAASWLQVRSRAFDTAPDFVTTSRRRLEARLEREKAASVSKAPRLEDLGPWNALIYLFSQKSFVYRFALATLLVVMFVMTTNRVAGAAQRALPGDQLYPLKISIEKVNLAMAMSDARRVELNINFAERRLEEIHRLVAQNRFEHLSATIDKFESHTEQASVPLETLVNTDELQAKTLAGELKDVIDQESDSLPALRDEAPQEAQQEITRLIGLTGAIRDKADRIESRPSSRATPVAGLSPRTDTPVPPTPTNMETATDTPAPSATHMPTSTSTPEEIVVIPPVSATAPDSPTPSESPEVDETRVATTTMTPKPAPVVSFTASSQIVTESRPSIVIAAQLKDDQGNPVKANQPVSVPVSISGSATLGLDFTISPTPLVIPTGSSSAYLIVNLNDDGVDEPDETVIFTMGAPSNAVLGSPAQYTVTLTHEVTVFFTKASQSVHENARSVDIEVQLIPEQATAVRLSFSLGGTAVQDRDYTLKGGPTLVIPAGQTKGYISLSLKSDGLDEADETVQVTLNSSDGAKLGSPGTQLLTLIDDDPEPELTFAEGDLSVMESVGRVSVELQLSAASSLPITVPLSLSGSATQGIDIQFSRSSIVIPPGSLSVAVDIEVIDDHLPELNKTAVITLGQPANAVLGMPNVYLLTLVDDDPQPALSFAQAEQSAMESAGNLRVLLQLSTVSSLPITVPLSLSGTATPGIDYLFDQTDVFIPPGSSSASIDIQVMDDLLMESYETVVIALGQPANAVLGLPNDYTLTLVDDDPQPAVNIVQPDQAVEESAGIVSVQVKLSAVSSLPITVPLSLSGSATPDIDFVLGQSYLVIPPGSSAASLDVQLVDDLTPESTEIVVIALEQPTNAITVVPITQTITILPSDQPVCNIFAYDPIVPSIDNEGLESSFFNLGSDKLLLTQMTIEWPTEVSGRPSLSMVFLENNLIFAGNERFSPQTITSWIGLDARRLLTSTPSTVSVRFARPILAGNYVMTLVFHNVTQGFDCAPVTQSLSIP